MRLLTRRGKPLDIAGTHSTVCKTMDRQAVVARRVGAHLLQSTSSELEGTIAVKERPHELFASLMDGTIHGRLMDLTVQWPGGGVLRDQRREHHWRDCSGAGTSSYEGRVAERCARWQCRALLHVAGLRSRATAATTPETECRAGTSRICTGAQVVRPSGKGWDPTVDGTDRAAECAKTHVM